MQHDQYPNSYHKNIKEYNLQKRHDRQKEDIAASQNTIFIKIKEINGFDQTNLNDYQQEIIDQFEDQSDTKLHKIPKYYYDRASNNLKKYVND